MTEPIENHTTNENPTTNAPDDFTIQLANLLKNSLGLQSPQNQNTESLSIGFKLNGDNYPLWAILMKKVIGGRGKAVYLTGDPPTSSDPTYQSQSRLGRLSSHIREWNRFPTTDIWMSIDRKEPNPIECSKDIDRYNKIIQQQRLFQFFTALSNVYEPVKKDLLKKEPLPSVEFSYGMVRRETARDWILRPVVVDGEDTSSGIGVGLVAKDRNRSAQKGNRPREDKTHLVCTHCGMKKHTKESCFQLVGYPEWWDKTKKTKLPAKNRGGIATVAHASDRAISAGTGNSDSGMVDGSSAERGGSMIDGSSAVRGEARVSSGEGKGELNGTGSVLYSGEKENKENCNLTPIHLNNRFQILTHLSTACTTPSDDTNKNTQWIFDCGATDTMSFDKMDFVQSTPSRRTHVQTANGELAPVKGAGTIALSPTLKLTGEIIGRGTERAGLYYVDEIAQQGAVMLTHGSGDRTAWLWHRRLVFIHIPKQKGHKLSPCAVKCVFVGYGRNQKGYRCYDPKTRHMFTTMNCDFLETEYFYHHLSRQGEKQGGNDSLNWLSMPMSSSVPEAGPPDKVNSTAEIPSAAIQSTELDVNAKTSSPLLMSEVTYHETRDPPYVLETDNNDRINNQDSENEEQTPTTDVAPTVVAPETDRYMLPPRSTRGVPPERYSPEYTGRKTKYSIGDFAKGNLTETAKSHECALLRGEEIPRNPQKSSLYNCFFCFNNDTRITDYHLTMFLLLSCVASSALGATTIFNVLSYGAVGNGRTDDSQAFLKAWNAACKYEAKSGVPVVYAPAKKTFLLDPLTFKGPCKSSRIYMLVSGNIVAPVKGAWSGKQVEGWIIFSNVKGLILKGKAVFDAKGASWWPTNPCFDDPAHGVICKGPPGMIFKRCEGLRLDGFSKMNGPGTHILIMSTNDVVASNLRVIAPANTPNTDAINISGSTKVRITNTFIATGDDCIAVSAGSSNIDISGITCGPGHGISIGSLGRGGFDVVENVRVRNCTLKKTLTGVRIKTVQGGKGLARNISFQGIKFEAVDNPIQIEQFYCPLQNNCQNFTSAVGISDVTFRAISGTSIAENVISLKCSQTSGCTNIRIDRVYITSTTPGKKVSATCFNAHGSATHTRPSVNCLLP
ncbi:hypothetical protein C2S52_001105 [Perilla frutescens var. hirtella]|nr:hypothetical protein C2S52_001105 [Perilla frutescens var. hirtella]